MVMFWEPKLIIPKPDHESPHRPPAYPFNDVVWQAFSLAGAQDDGTMWCLGGGT